MKPITEPAGQRSRGVPFGRRRRRRRRRRMTSPEAGGICGFSGGLFFLAPPRQGKQLSMARSLPFSPWPLPRRQEGRKATVQLLAASRTLYLFCSSTYALSVTAESFFLKKTFSKNILKIRHF
jgi:hypothetical protein